MKLIHMLITLSVLLNAKIVSSQEPIETDSTVTDVDGNVYPIVQIGNQIWMAENLRVTHYSDGTPLEYSLRSPDIAYDDTTTRFFYYSDDSANVENYGCLYPWFTAIRGITGSDANPSGIQGICPEGWHLPSIGEWEELVRFLGEDSAAARLHPGGSSGFNAQFGGTGGNETKFQQMHTRGFYLTADPGEYDDIDPFSDHIILFGIDADPPRFLFGSHSKTCGYSVRAVKDNPTTSIEHKQSSPLPETFCLFQNYPNPFNPSTTIRFELARSENVQLKVYNTNGQEIQTLVDDVLSAGEHTILWHAEGLPAGIYLARLQAGAQLETMKLVLQK